MKKIAYIELDTHSEIALNFYELMKNSECISVDYYFSEKIMNCLGFSKSKNVFLSDEKTILHQLKKQNYDEVIIGTVHRYFSTFHLISKAFKTSFIAHNLNFIALKKRNLFSLIFKEETLYRLKLLLKEGLFLLPKIKRNADRIFVLDKNRATEKMIFLPIFYHQFENQKQDDDILKIVISGEVSQKRRDYKKVLRWLQKTNQKMEIVFLGKAKGEERQWLQDFEKQKPPHLKIIYFQEKVPTSIFDDYMTKADLLWCPIQRETSFFSQQEIYGETKISGNLGDAIKYGKIALFPRDFKSDFPFIINENYLPMEEQFQQMKSLKFDFQKEFSKEKVQQELEAVLLEI